MNITDIIEILKEHANPKNVEGMARFGINPKNTLGVSMPFLRSLAKEINTMFKNENAGKHLIASELWWSEIHEARILAALIDVPSLVTEEQMDEWVIEFDSWDVCDQVCGNLFDKTPFAFKKALEWSHRTEEFVKRAGFVLMATLSVHNKHADDNQFIQFFKTIEKEAADDRNFVRKAVNWAIRQIGKRNEYLNKEAVVLCEKIEKHQSSKSARWITKDALRELTNEKVLHNLRRKKKPLPYRLK